MSVEHTAFKWCPTCQTRKAVDDFGINRSRKTGVSRNAESATSDPGSMVRCKPFAAHIECRSMTTSRRGCNSTFVACISEANSMRQRLRRDQSRAAQIRSRTECEVVVDL